MGIEDDNLERVASMTPTITAESENENGDTRESAGTNSTLSPHQSSRHSQVASLSINIDEIININRGIEETPQNKTLSSNDSKEKTCNCIIL